MSGERVRPLLRDARLPPVPHFFLFLWFGRGILGLLAVAVEYLQLQLVGEGQRAQFDGFGGLSVLQWNPLVLETGIGKLIRYRATLLHLPSFKRF